MDETPAEVEALKDSRLIVWSQEQGRRLFRTGYFGKPLGLPKPKEDFDAPLILDPIEGVYLLERRIIRVVSGDERREVGLDEVVAFARKTLEGFDAKYLVYSDLRDRGFVVTPGIKYGCDFAVYRSGPGIDHAPYIVQVKGMSDGLSASEIVQAGRLATTVRKTFIIAVVDGEEVRYLGFKWWKP
ncbi:MAG: tRNA-intron lyase [Candidatus Bathyarchaeia archaeon]